MVRIGRSDKKKEHYVPQKTVTTYVLYVGIYEINMTNFGCGLLVSVLIFHVFLISSAI